MISLQSNSQSTLVYLLVQLMVSFTNHTALTLPRQLSSFVLLI
jgi:hypothetical protein